MSKKRTADSYEFSTKIQQAFGERLQRTRERSGQRQSLLVSALGLSRTSISNIERGTHRVFLDQAYRAAYALNVDIQELLPPMTLVPLPTTVHTPADDPLSPSAKMKAEKLAESLMGADLDLPRPKKRRSV